jgi:hypothetical protein
MSNADAGTSPEINLVRCRPLRDPVQALSTIFKIGTFGGTALCAILFIIIPASSDPHPGILVVFGIFAVVVGTMPGIAVMTLLGSNRRRRAILVRKFKNDNESARLQQLIAAGLGDRYRLCGIRSPVKRVSLWFRLLFWYHAAISYVGSQYQQLEAEDNDWLARLLQTLENSDLAIIDMRSATEFVLIEARTCIAALGIGRIIFIIDSAPNSARSLEPLQIPREHWSELRALVFPKNTDAEEPFVAAIAGAVKSLPAIPSTGREQALRLVRAHIKDADFQTRFLATDLGQFLLSTPIAAAVGATGAIALWEMGGPAESWSILIAVSFLILAAIAWWRLWRAGRLNVPSAKGYRKSVGVRLRRSFVLMAVPLLVIAFEFTVLMPALQKAHDSAIEIQQLAILRQIGQGLAEYQSIYPAHLQPRSDGKPNGIYPFPTDLPSALASVDSPVAPKELQYDVWGRPLVYQPAADEVILFSSGLDGKPDTGDDLCMRRDGSTEFRRYLNDAP